MDSFSLSAIIKILGEFGPLGLVILLYWLSERRTSALIETHRKELTDVQAQNGKDMAEQRKMYEANASLCRDFSSVASDLREIVIMNIERMTRVEETVRQNQFCPLVRTEKNQARMRQD